MPDPEFKDYAVCGTKSFKILILQVHAYIISIRTGSDGSSLDLDTWASSANQRPDLPWPWPMRGQLWCLAHYGAGPETKTPGLRPSLSVSVVRIMTRVWTPFSLSIFSANIFFIKYFPTDSRPVDVCVFPVLTDCPHSAAVVLSLSLLSPSWSELTNLSHSSFFCQREPGNQQNGTFEP